VGAEPEYRADELESTGLAIVIWVFFFLALAGVPLLIPLAGSLKASPRSSPHWTAVDLVMIAYAIAGAVIIQWIAHPAEKLWAKYAKTAFIGIYLLIALGAVIIVATFWHAPDPHDPALQTDVVSWAWLGLVVATLLSIASVILYSRGRK
jgi:hypothetical protein